MPEEKIVMAAKEMALKPRVFFVKAEFEVFRNRTGLGAVVERHHEDRQEDHRWNGTHPVEVTGHKTVFGSRGGHADDFLGSEIGGEEGETSDPSGDGAA